MPMLLAITYLFQWLKLCLFCCLQNRPWEPYTEGRRRKSLHLPHNKASHSNVSHSNAVHNNALHSNASHNNASHSNASHTLTSFYNLCTRNATNFSMRNFYHQIAQSKHHRNHFLLSNLPNITTYLFILLFIGLNCRGVTSSKSSANGLRQRFANQPSPQTAVIGSTVVLPCRVINMIGELQWTRDDFGLGNERELVAFKRYKMIGSHEEGEVAFTMLSRVNV